MTTRVPIKNQTPPCFIRVCLLRASNFIDWNFAYRTVIELKQNSTAAKFFPLSDWHISLECICCLHRGWAVYITVICIHKILICLADQDLVSVLSRCVDSDWYFKLIITWGRSYAYRNKKYKSFSINSCQKCLKPYPTVHNKGKFNIVSESGWYTCTCRQWNGCKNFLSSIVSRLNLGPTQVLGAVSPGVKRPGLEAAHSPTSAKVKKTWIYTSTAP
jgi:hypothetical protein